MKIKNRTVFLGYICAISATAIWSGNFIIARGLNDIIPPVGLAFWRWVVAVVIFLPFAIKPLVSEWNIIRDNLKYLSVTAFLGVTVFNTLIYFAGHTTTAINLSLISITFPVFIVILSRLIYGERITINKCIGIILVATGVALLITKGDLWKLLHIKFATGDIWMLIAAFIFAVYSLLLKRKPVKLSIWSFQLSTFIAGLLFLLPFYILERTVTGPVVFEPSTIGSILYVGIFASLSAFILWNKAILLVGPSKAGMVYYTLPLFSGFLAYLFLNEEITKAHLFSLLLIFSGIITANYQSKK